MNTATIGRLAVNLNATDRITVLYNFILVIFTIIFSVKIAGIRVPSRI